MKLKVAGQAAPVVSLGAAGSGVRAAPAAELEATWSRGVSDGKNEPVHTIISDG